MRVLAKTGSILQKNGGSGSRWKGARPLTASSQVAAVAAPPDRLPTYCVGDHDAMVHLCRISSVPRAR